MDLAFQALSTEILLLNGSTAVSAGLACMSTDVLDEAKKLEIVIDIHDKLDIVRTIEAIVAPDALLPLLQRAAAIAIHHSLLPGFREEVPAVRVSRVDEVADEIPADAVWNLQDSSADGKIWSLVIASKVAFFSTNHHLGGQTGTASGYMAKMLNLVLEDGAADDETIVNAVHRMVHWFDTKAILTNLVRFAVHGNALPEGYPMIEQDVVTRLRSAPAGCAKLFYCDAVLRAMSNTPLLRYLPASFMDIRGQVDQVRLDPLAYHVGAAYLVGAENRRVFDMDESLVANCREFVTKVFRRSTIARTKFASLEMPNALWVAAVSAYVQALSGGEIAENMEQQIAQALGVAGDVVAVSYQGYVREE